MKTLPLLLSALLSATAALGATTAPVLTTQIVKLTPAIAVVGETIEIKTKMSAAARGGLQLGAVPPLQHMKILFPAAKGAFIEGNSLSRTVTGSFTVQVPAGAVSGNLRLQIGKMQSTSTVPFTLSTTGLSMVNFSQFNIVSLKLDGTERIAGRSIPATPSSASEVYENRFAVTAGQHELEVVLGPASNQPVLVWNLPVSATAGRIIEVPLTAMSIGEYLVSAGSPSATANTLNATWQPLTAATVPNGYDFAYDPATKITTWKRWTNTAANVTASGIVEEPATWALNGSTFPIRLLVRKGVVSETLRVNVLQSTFTNARNLVFGMP